jgi:L-fuconolactonase
MIIDAHHHFWAPERGDYHWMSDDVPVLAQPYGPNDLKPHLRKAGVVGTVLVQAAQTVAETDYLLDIAVRTDFVLGVVGWLDMEADDFAALLDRYHANPFFIGLRPMLQDLDDDEWILRPKVLNALKVVADRDVAFEFLTFPRHLHHAAKACAQVPELRALVDHVSKPPIATGDLDPWRDDMQAMANIPGMMCKLSGMVTEAEHAKWRPADLAPYVDHVWNVFGADRLMFGSDWPVCRLAAEYGEVVNALRTCLAGKLDGTATARIFGQNAIDFYRIPQDQLDRAKAVWS